jgi:multicomponent Na+:H+ antiporter subunit B
MTRLSFFSILLTAVLGVLFIYVAEDIPALGDPDSPPIKYTFLFSVDADGVEKELDQGVLPSRVRETLQKRRFPPSSRIERIPNTKGEWVGYIEKEEPRYPKEEKYYHLRLEGKKLTVFRYAFVVRWIEKGLEETAVPNMVTYGLADYRGYDTLGETTVIFTAGVSVILLLRRRGRLS